MKMTLIDKDKFIQDVISRKYSQASMRLIREQPEVKAITIEWIKDKMDKLENIGRLEFCEYLDELLVDWEEENETN